MEGSEHTPVQNRKRGQDALSPLAAEDSMNKLPKREVPSKDEFFMDVAVAASRRSRDPKTQVGACLVDKGKATIIGVGYNGAPNGIDDESTFPWLSENEQGCDKNFYVIHAEVNALLQAHRSEISQSIMYCTHYPCLDCAKTMLHLGVKHIFYQDDSKRSNEAYKRSVKLLDYTSQENIMTTSKFGEKPAELTVMNPRHSLSRSSTR